MCLRDPWEIPHIKLQCGDLIREVSSDLLESIRALILPSWVASSWPSSFVWQTHEISTQSSRDAGLLCTRAIAWKLAAHTLVKKLQVEKEILLLKVWYLFKMVFVSIATIFKCTETHQELYEKLPMFPLPRIRTPTSPIFCSTSPIALSLLLLKYLKACPISCHLSPLPYSSEHLFKKKKSLFLYPRFHLCA